MRSGVRRKEFDLRPFLVSVCFQRRLVTVSGSLAGKNWKSFPPIVFGQSRKILRFDCGIGGGGMANGREIEATSCEEESRQRSYRDDRNAIEIRCSKSYEMSYTPRR